MDTNFVKRIQLFLLSVSKQKNYISPVRIKVLLLEQFEAYDRNMKYSKFNRQKGKQVESHTVFLFPKIVNWLFVSIKGMVRDFVFGTKKKFD